MDKSWTLGILSSLVIITSIIYWNQQNQQTLSQMPLELINGNQEPNIYMENVMTTEFDASGQKRYQLSSHTLSDIFQITRLSKPDLQLYSKAHGVWHIQAKNGTLSRNKHNNQILDLSNNVVVYVQNSADTSQQKQDRLKITTSFLSINLDHKFAQTEQTVIMHSPTMQAKGTGMLADINKGQVNLGTVKSGHRSKATVLPHKSSIPEQSSKPEHSAD